MRERLIELIADAVGGCSTYWAGLIADYLLANGVVVLPCKLGDDLYWVEGRSDGDRVRKYCHPIDLIALAEDGWYVCADYVDSADALYHCEKLNTKYAYLSEEEAEQALKEGAE